MNLNYKKICRLCLCLCDKYVDLKETNGVQTLAAELTEKIKFCYQLQLDLLGELPTKVCYECIQVISYFYNTKKNLFISEQFLRNVFYVRKKLQDGDKVSNEENLKEPEIIVIEPEENKTEQTKSLDNCETPCIEASSELNQDDNSECASNVECNIKTKCDNSPEKTTNFKQTEDNAVDNNKKCSVAKTHSVQNNELKTLSKAPSCMAKVSLLLEDIGEDCQKFKIGSKLCKDAATPKGSSKTNSLLKANAATEIDKSNTLSPSAKRKKRGSSQASSK